MGLFRSLIMMLGLALSLCSPPQGSADLGEPAYDPAVLSLSGWFRAAYLATTSSDRWSGTPSAGTSSARKLIETTNFPARGAALLGLTPADYDGTNDRLNDQPAVFLDSYVSASQWYAATLVEVDAAAANGANFYDDAALVGEQNGGWGISIAAGGVRACNYDGGYDMTLRQAVPIGTGAKVFVEAWLVGGFLHIAVNGVEGTPVASGNLTVPSARQLRLGANYNNTVFFNGRQWEVFLSATVPSEEARTSLRESYICSRYGVNLTGDVEHVCPPTLTGYAWPSCTAPDNQLYAATLKTAAAAYDITDGARLVYFASKYWTLGGWSTSPRDWGDGVPAYTTNQIWSSVDLITWTLEFEHDPAPPTSGAGAMWTPRHTFMSWVVGGYLYIAGSDQYPTKPIPSDVWRTADGTTWERIAESCPWGAQGRSGDDVGVGGVWNPIPGYLNGYAYVMGGHRYTDLVTDVLDWPATAEVWRSSDFINWTQVSDMPFVRAGILDAPTLCGKIFLSGGNAGTNTARALKSDTWGFDGGSWLEMSATSKSVWTARDYIATVAYDDKLWVLNGFDGVNAGGAHWSRDLGRTWEKALIAPWAGSHADGVTVSAAGIAIATGNGLGKNTYLLTTTP